MTHLLRSRLGVLRILTHPPSLRWTPGGQQRVGGPSPGAGAAQSRLRGEGEAPAAGATCPPGLPCSQWSVLVGSVPVLAVTRRRERRGPRKRPAGQAHWPSAIRGGSRSRQYAPRPPHRTRHNLLSHPLAFPQLGHRSRAKAQQRSLSCSRHAPANTTKTAQAGRDGHVAVAQGPSAGMICFSPVRASHSYPHLLIYLFKEAWRLLRKAAASRIFAVALGNLSGRARDPETAASVANEVVS